MLVPVKFAAIPPAGAVDGMGTSFANRSPAW
jgi:hypothetical protein